MAKGNMRKGFARYLLVLLLMIVAAFLIILVIMLFSPFHNVLGFQYILYEIDQPVYRTTSEELIDFSRISEININCNNAGISIERAKIENDAINIENRTKGFAHSGDNTDFNYEIYYSDDNNSILNIDVTEPDGFLFFDNRIEITICVPALSSYSLENTVINITNTSGDISIGNRDRLSINEDESHLLSDINVNTLNISTESGDISLNQYLESTLDKLYINSSSGDITFFTQQLNITDTFEMHKNSGFVCIMNLSTTSQNGLIFDLNNSQLRADVISGNMMLNMNSGYLDLRTLNGNLNSNDAVVQMNDATLTIENIEGDVSLPFANNSQINIGQMAQGNQVYVRGENCDLNIEGLRGKAFIETTEGDVNIHTYQDDLDIKTTSGNINVVYESYSIDNQLDLYSQFGDINLSVLSQLSFALYANNTEGEANTNLTVQFFSGPYSNPFIVGNGNKIINATTNGNITVDLIQ